eukprot:NODE_132_length_16614_cov_0.935392.p6 type:complete len:362 gc:universal NODE_132_length_16614_cov_0.935392:7485-8570(+)
MILYVHILAFVSNPFLRQTATKFLIFPRPGFCRRICVRKEIHTWSKEEVIRFRNAINLMYNDGLWRQLVQIHIDAKTYAHWNSVFFPFHRAFLAILEQTLQTYYDPNICLPYWDVTREAGNPFSSIVWSPDYFGGNGVPNLNYCVRTGPFAHFTDNTGMCMQRMLGLNAQMNQQPPNFGYFVDRNTIDQIIARSPNYEYFRAIIELFPHQMIHVGISGTMRTMGSPLDPIFYLIHAFFDKTWYDFQIIRGASLPPYSGSSVDMRMVMQWVRVSGYDALDPKNLCATYAKSPPSQQSVSVRNFAPIPNDWLAMNGISPQDASMWAQRFQAFLPTQIATGPTMMGLEASEFSPVKYNNSTSGI